jgi:hypothetical protein
MSISAATRFEGASLDRRIGRAANARKLGRAKPRLGAMTANHVRQGADSTAGLIMQLP